MTLKRTRIKSRSDRRADESALLAEVYAQIARERPQVCAGCGKPAGGLIKLSHSHLVPRSYNQSLICEPENIAYHCVDWMGHKGCHSKWESSAHRASLLDFERNLDYIVLADRSYYSKLLLKTIPPSCATASS
jgi:hypothetical protein